MILMQNTTQILILSQRPARKPEISHDHKKKPNKQHEKGHTRRGNYVILGLSSKLNKTGENLRGSVNVLVFIYTCFFVLGQLASSLAAFSSCHNSESKTFTGLPHKKSFSVVNIKYQSLLLTIVGPDHFWRRLLG